MKDKEKLKKHFYQAKLDELTAIGFRYKNFNKPLKIKL
jgi:hypothetical protein